MWITLWNSNGLGVIFFYKSRWCTLWQLSVKTSVKSREKIACYWIWQIPRWFLNGKCFPLLSAIELDVMLVFFSFFFLIFFICEKWKNEKKNGEIIVCLCNCEELVDMLLQCSFERFLWYMIIFFFCLFGIIYAKAMIIDGFRSGQNVLWVSNGLGSLEIDFSQVPLEGIEVETFI